MATNPRIPLPLPATPRATGSTEPCGRLVGEFVTATAALTCDVAATLAGVRPATILGWRRRLPRWLKAGTAKRLRAHLTGEVFRTPEAGFRKVFSERLRKTPLDGM